MGRKRQSEHGLPAGLHFKHGAYYHVSGTPRKWTRLDPDLAKAKLLWAQHESAATLRTLPADTMGQLIDRYLCDVLTKKATKTQRDQTQQAELLRRVFGAMVPKDIRPQHVARYLDERGKTAPIAANREKALLSHIFSMAMRWGVVDMNPCKGIHRNTENKRSRYITDAEYRAVWDQSSPSVRNAMDLSYYTGQRIGDILTLTWRHVAEGTITLQQGKTGARIAITITPSLQKVLDRIRNTGKLLSIHLVHTLDGQPYTYGGFSVLFRRATAAVDVADFHFHDIRAKSLTDLERQGTPKDAIQLLAGHTSVTMTERYLKARAVVSAVALDREL